MNETIHNDVRSTNTENKNITVPTRETVITHLKANKDLEDYSDAVIHKAALETADRVDAVVSMDVTRQGVKA